MQKKHTRDPTTHFTVYHWRYHIRWRWPSSPTLDEHPSDSKITFFTFSLDLRRDCNILQGPMDFAMTGDQLRIGVSLNPANVSGMNRILQSLNFHRESSFLV